MSFSMNFINQILGFDFSFLILPSHKTLWGFSHSPGLVLSPPVRGNTSPPFASLPGSENGSCSRISIGGSVTEMKGKIRIKPCPVYFKPPCRHWTQCLGGCTARPADTPSAMSQGLACSQHTLHALSGFRDAQGAARRARHSWTLYSVPPQKSYADQSTVCSANSWQFLVVLFLCVIVVSIFLMKPSQNEHLPLAQKVMLQPPFPAQSAIPGWLE